MALYQNYPYTDLQTLNLDGVLRQVKTNTDNIETNTSDIAAETAAREQADQQESAARAAADANLQQQINALDPAGNVSAIAYDKKTLAGTVIMIGDSYAAGWTPDGDVESWCVKFANRIGKTLNTDAFIYSKGGAGFVNTVDGVNFGTLLQTAANNPAITDSSAVKYIIVLGGYNDRGRSESDVGNAVVNFIGNAATYFPDALVMIGNVGYSHDSYSVYQKYRMGSAYAYGDCAHLGDIWTVLQLPGRLSSDNVHPNNAGQYAICRALYDKIFAGDFYNDSLEPTNFSDLAVSINASVAHHVLNLDMYAQQAIGVHASTTLSGGCDGTRQLFSVSCPYFHTGSTTIYTFEISCIFYAGGAFLRGQMLMKLNGNSLQMYPVLLNSGGTNWQGIQTISEVMFSGFHWSIPYNAI